MLGYCSSVWSPSQIGDIYAIESVQRLFTRRLTGLKDVSYEARLAVLKLPTLELRRLRADLLLCFKIIHGYVGGPPSNYGLFFVQGKSTRGHDRKLFCGHNRIEARRNYFGNRIIAPWNSLPAAIVNLSSPECFKRALLNFNLEKFLHFTF